MMNIRALAAVAALTFAGTAMAQDCQQATRNYEVSRNSLRPNPSMVDRAWQEMQAVCGPTAAPAQPPQQYYEPAPPPARRGPGRLVSCDKAGCWGAQNGVRYNFVAGGHLQGTDGSFCALGAGNNYSCN